MQWRINHPNFTNPWVPNFAVDFLNGSLPDAQGPRHRVDPHHGDAGRGHQQSISGGRRSAEHSTGSEVHVLMS